MARCNSQKGWRKKRFTLFSSLSSNWSLWSLRCRLVNKNRTQRSLPDTVSVHHEQQWTCYLKRNTMLQHSQCCQNKINKHQTNYISAVCCCPLPLHYLNNVSSVMIVHHILAPIMYVEYVERRVGYNINASAQCDCNNTMKIFQPHVWW